MKVTETLRPKNSLTNLSVLMNDFTVVTWRHLSARLPCLQVQGMWVLGSVCVCTLHMACQVVLIASYPQCSCRLFQTFLLSFFLLLSFKEKKKRIQNITWDHVKKKRDDSLSLQSKHISSVNYLASVQTLRSLSRFDLSPPGLTWSTFPHLQDCFSSIKMLLASFAQTATSQWLRPLAFRHYVNYYFITSSLLSQHLLIIHTWG